MANDKAITERDLLHKEIEHGWLYSGTRDELIAAGLATHGDLPGDPGAPVTAHTIKREGKKIHFSIHSRMAIPITFWVNVRLIESIEREQRERAAQFSAQFSREFPEVARKRHERDERDARIRAAIKAGEYLPLSCRESLRHTCWLGSREELIGSGACAPHHFPVGKKRKAWAHSEHESPELRRKGVKFWSTDALGRDHFTHAVCWDEDARKARERDGIGREERPRPGCYADAQEFAEGCELSLSASSRVLVEQITGKLEEEIYGDCTIRYDDNTISKVTAALDHARQLLQSAIPQFMKRRESGRIKAARGDAQFRAFLSRIPGLSVSKRPSTGEE